ncbi:MAG: lytic transglycosylase domain-containing protein [Pseudomonadota bacterium]
MRTIVFIAALIAFAGQSFAQSASSRSRTDLLRNQLDVLDNRAAQQYNSSIRLAPAPVIVPGTPGGQGASEPYDGSYRGPYLAVAREMALRHGIPPDLFLRLVNQESRWNASIRSHKGAIGLAQLMPATARDLGVDPTDPRQNLEGGARYLKEQYREFGTWRLALAAYNAGPGAVRRYNGVPPFRETRDYVRIILGN